MAKKWLFLFLRLLVVLFQRVLYIFTVGQLPPFATVSVVVRYNGKVLLIDRVDGKGWSLPGGFMRMHETTIEAVKRETREETGLEIEVTGILGVLSGRRAGTAIRSVEIVYAARPIAGQLKGSLEGECRWVDIENEKPNFAFDYKDLIWRTRGASV
ncbi:MAG: NUDIX hydrolase [candidate division KSB1 bacterium]|nr:NUDIX hydrolase [candidate division KSB1 bacterium]